MSLIRESTTLVRRSLWDSIMRLSLVRHEWAALPQDGEEPIGFAFADSMPSNVLLLELAHVRWFWCGSAAGTPGKRPI